MFNLIDYSKHVVFPHDQIFFATDFYFSTGVFAKENPIALFDFQGNSFAVIADLAVANSNNLTLGGFFLRSIRDDNSTFGGGFLFDALD